ncbi:MAG: response regulator [Desulfobacteraceae bacterium]|jgi:CheY-like chemotaxis protein
MAKKILVIDDDPIIVDYLLDLFEENGYETCSAENGVKGLEVLLREKPDLITLDLEMPEEWGPRFYRKLRKHEKVKDTPVIVLTGIDGDHAIRNAAGYVNKPFDPEKLLGIVKNAIG